MAVNLAVNVRDALQGCKIAKDIQCWLDSTVAPLVKRQWQISTIRCKSREQNEESRECAMATRTNF